MSSVLGPMHGLICSRPCLYRFLLYLGFVCVCSFGVWALSLQISSVLGLLHGFFCSRHCLCSFLCGVCLRRFRLCPGLVCVDYFCSGPYLCRFIVLWALCVNSFLVWALFVGFLLCVGLVRFTNKAQTHKQPTQTVPTTEESMQWAQNKRNLQREGPSTKWIYEQGTEHT